MAADIERWTADMPVTSWNEPFTRRARRWVRRNRTAVTAAVAAVIVALAGLGAVVAVQAQANRAHGPQRPAVRIQRTGEPRQRRLSAANEKMTQADAELMAEREKVQARFDLARDAIRLFHGEVSEDLLLKEKQLRKPTAQAPARCGRLLRQAGGTAPGPEGSGVTHGAGAARTMQLGDLSGEDRQSARGAWRAPQGAGGPPLPGGRPRG